MGLGVGRRCSDGPRPKGSLRLLQTVGVGAAESRETRGLQGERAGVTAGLWQDWAHAFLGFALFYLC